MQYYDIILYNSTKKFGNGIREYMGHAYLSAVLQKNGYKVKIVDSLNENLTPDQAIEAIGDYEFKYIGINFLSYGYEVTKEFVTKFKERWPNRIIIIGGHFVSFCWQEILKENILADYLLVGEGEETIVKLLKNLDDGRKMPRVIHCKKICKELDFIGFPDRAYASLLVKKGLPLSISSSRGCYQNCSFCSVNKFYKNYAVTKWRCRSAENVVMEMIDLNKRYGAKKFDFIDDNFSGFSKKGYERAIHIADLLCEKKCKFEISLDLRLETINDEFLKKWKEAGLKTVLIGIESICVIDQNLYNKKIDKSIIIDKVNLLKKYGINFKLGTILWNPFTTVDSLIKNLKFFYELGYLETHPLVKVNVYKGTDLYEKLEHYLEGNFYNIKWIFKNQEMEHIYNELFSNIKFSYNIINKYYKDNWNQQEKILRLNMKFMLKYLENVKASKNNENLIEIYRGTILWYLEKGKCNA